MVSTTPNLLYTGKATQYLLYSRLGWPWGLSEWTQKIMPPPAFNPQTVQSIASHYTNYTIVDHTIKIKKSCHNGRGTARYEGSMAVTLETVSFCNMAPYHHLTKFCTLHYYSALRMGLVGSFKNVVYFCQTTRCHIP